MYSSCLDWQEEVQGGRFYFLKFYHHILGHTVYSCFLCSPSQTEKNAFVFGRSGQKGLPKGRFGFSAAQELTVPHC